MKTRRPSRRRRLGALTLTFALLSAVPLGLAKPLSDILSPTEATAATVRDHRTGSPNGSTGETTTRDHRKKSGSSTDGGTTTTRDHRRKSGPAYDALESGGHLDRTVTAATERRLTFSQGTHTVRLTNCSANTKPYVHILDEAYQQVAMGSPLAQFKPSSAAQVGSNSYRIVMRARDNTAGGACDLEVDGSVTERNVQVGGWKVRLSKLRRGESIQTVALAPSAVNSPAPQHVIYEMAGNAIRRRHGGPGATEQGVGFGAPNGTIYVVVATTDQTRNARIRLIRNDAGLAKHDKDADGLGDELEASLGTCSDRTSRVKGFDCRQAADARDTDGDGISDSLEVLGRRDVAPYQALPFWGADARHKDLFLEVDFANGCWTNSNPKPAAADRRMPAAAAREMARIYADGLGDTTSAQQTSRAKQLRNPDGRRGIRLHIDSGRAPQKREDITVYGDWGGFGEIPATMDADSNCLGYGNGGDNWQTRMSAARRGIFHYVAGYLGGGGAAREFRVYSQWNMASAVNAAHEFGHSLGIGHSGPAHRLPGDPNCKPNYASIMNYAYYDHRGAAPDVGFSDGSRGPVLDNQSVAERSAVDPTDTRYLDHLEKVFGYNVDRALGHVDWNRDGVFSPTPVQAYTNYAPGGAGCEWTRYNAVAVDTTGKVALSPAVASMRSRLYSFFVQSSTGRLAYASSGDSFDCPDAGKGCAGSKFSRPQTTSIDATQGVAAVRVDREDILVVTNDVAGNLWASHVSRATGQDRWSAPLGLAIERAAGEPALVSDGRGWALLAYRSAIDQRVVVVSFDVDRGWGTPTPAGALDAGGNLVLLPQMSESASPGLTFADLPDGGKKTGATRVYGLFADQSGVLRVWRLERETLIFTPAEVFDGIAPTIIGRPSGAMVSIRDAANRTTRPGPFHLSYLDTAGRPKRMRTFADGAKSTRFRRSYQKPTWQGARVDWCDQWAKDCGEPAADHFCQLRIGGDAKATGFKKANDIGKTTPTRTLVEGRTCAKAKCDGFETISCERSSDGVTVRDHRTNTAGPSYWVGLDGPFDNTWTRHQGITLFHERGVDTGLRAMAVTAGGVASFRPNADGLTSIEIADVSDWKVFSVTLCRTLMRPNDALGGKIDTLISEPVQCLDWEYPRH